MTVNSWAPALALTIALASLPACTEPAVEGETFLNISVTPRRVNVADLDAEGASERIRIGISAPSVADGEVVAVSLSDFAMIEDYGVSSGQPTPLEGGPDSFALAVLLAGQSELGARCTGNSGTGTILGILLQGGQPVAEATTDFECYLDDASRYQLGLGLDRSVVEVGQCTSARVRGVKDSGKAAEGLTVEVGCTGCTFEGQTDEELKEASSDGVNRKEFFLDPEGRVEARMCCTIPGRVGVRADWGDEKYGNPDRIETDDFTCIEEGGDAQILIEADRHELRVGDDPDTSRTSLTITLLGPGGVPASGKKIRRIQVSKGLLDARGRNTAPSDEDRQLLDLQTDDRGEVEVYFWSGDKPGEAKIDVIAVLELEGQEPVTLLNSTTVQVIGLGAIDCVPPEDPFLTVAGSGGQETAKICFRVMSTAERPFPDFPVEFSLPTSLPCRGDPGACGSAWLTPSRTETNADGLACTFLHSGRISLPVAVRAVGRLRGAPVYADCPSVPIVGGRTSARGLALVCDTKNVGALIETDGINSLVDHPIPCHILLKDRFGNPVPSSTNISFRSEAGTITHSVATPGRPPGGGAAVDDPAISRATAIFQTFGALPKDVPPLPPDPEAGRPIAEPSLTDDLGRTRNPRDGLVSIIAYTVGEEEFTDMNGDGRYNVGEPFVDLGEPFVDYNDSGLRDLDEPFIDLEVPATDEERSVNCPPGVLRRSRAGIWDGPNGCWDSNSVIWTQTRILYTGHPYTFRPNVGPQHQSSSGWLESGLYPWVSPDSPRFEIQKGDIKPFRTRFVDENLNLLNASAIISIATRGPVAIMMGDTSEMRVEDSWGMDYSILRRCSGDPLEPASWGACQIYPSVRSFNLHALDTGSGYDWKLTLAANAPGDGPCCAPPPANPDDLPELYPEHREEDRCQPPDGFAFPDEIDAAPPPEEPPAEGEGEGEAPEPPKPWVPAVFEDTTLNVTVNYGISERQSGGWQAQYELFGRSCGTVVLDSASGEDSNIPTSCLRGRVLGPRDVPVEGASVRILDPPPGFVPDPAFTDENGEYCLVSALGRPNIAADFEGDDGFVCRSAPTNVQVEAGESDCALDCQPGPVLTCEVVEGEDGGQAGDGGDDGDGDDGGGDGDDGNDGDDGGGEDGGEGEGDDGGDGDDGL